MGSVTPIVGLAGGIGSGKSTVASCLESLGAKVISSDRLNHEELNTPEIQSTLRSWWGDRIILPDGQTDRDVIREIVIRDPRERTRLEELVHPRIAERRDALMARWRADPAVRMIVWDSPLLFEAGLAEKCDCVIFVDADREVRLERVGRKRGWSIEEFDRLEKTQKPLDFKRAGADYRVVNNSDVRCLHEQVEDVFSEILSGR